MRQCDPQVIPELKLQISELQRQKQELEGLVEDKDRELEGRSEFGLANSLIMKLFWRCYTSFTLVIQKKKTGRSLTPFTRGLQKRACNAGELLHHGRACSSIKGTIVVSHPDICCVLGTLRRKLRSWRRRTVSFRAEWRNWKRRLIT